MPFDKLAKRIQTRRGASLAGMLIFFLGIAAFAAGIGGRYYVAQQRNASPSVPPSVSPRPPASPVVRPTVPIVTLGVPSPSVTPPVVSPQPSPTPSLVPSSTVSPTPQLSPWSSPSSFPVPSPQTPISPTARWRLLGPSDGRVNSVLITAEDAVLAGTNSGGIFITRDRGTTWSHYSAGLTASDIYEFREAEGTIYAAAGDGIYTLSPRAHAWRKVHVPSSLGAILHITRDARGTLWAMREYELLRSLRGTSWETVMTFPSAELHVALFASNEGPLYVSTWGGLFWSDDFGASWTRMFDAVSSITEDDEGTLYVRQLVGDAPAYKRRRGETSFHPIAALPQPKIGTLAYRDNVLFAESPASLFFSRDGGVSFVEVAASATGMELFEGSFWDIRQIVPLPNDRVLLANDDGVSEIDINTRTVRNYAPLPQYAEINSLAVSRRGDHLLTAYWDHIPRYSRDEGRTWLPMYGGEASFYVLDPQAERTYIVRDEGQIALFADTDRMMPLWIREVRVADPRNSVAVDATRTPTRAYAFFEYFEGQRRGMLLRFNMASDPQAVAVEEIELPFIAPSSIAVDPRDGSRILILADGKLYESRDSGRSWQEVVDLRTVGFEMAVNPHDSREILMGGVAGNIIRIRGDAVSEFKLPSDTAAARDNFVYVYAVAYDDENPNVIYAGSQQGFFVTVDRGAAWYAMNAGLYAKDIRKIIVRGSRIFIGTWGSGNAVIEKSALFRDVRVPL